MKRRNADAIELRRPTDIRRRHVIHATMKSLVLRSGGRLSMLHSEDVHTPCGLSYETLSRGVRSGAFGVITSNDRGWLTLLAQGKDMGRFSVTSTVHPSCPQCLEAWREWRVSENGEPVPSETRTRLRLE